MMKWIRLFCLGALLTLGSCRSPTVPRIPQEETPPPSHPDTSKVGFQGGRQLPVKLA